MNESEMSVPLIWREPSSSTSIRDLVVWLPGFTGLKDRMLPHLEAFAEAGFYAVSYDLLGHGERLAAGETMHEMALRVKSNRRRYFWPIIGETAEDMPRVIDWAVRRFAINGRIVAGGVSAGGDIAITAASLDPRIEAVCACIATPDWRRTGSAEEQGTEDAYSRSLLERLNPIDHPGRFSHRPWIRFDNAADDKLVPPDAARRLQELLRGTHYSAEPHKIEIIEHTGAGHAFTNEMWDRSLNWLTRFRSGAE